MKQKLNKLGFIDIETHRVSTQYNRLAKKYPDVIGELLTHTSFVPQGKHELYERLYCVLNDIHEQPLCSHCHQPMLFSFSKKRYGQFHRHCSQKDSCVRLKYKDSMIKKYGVTSPMLCDDIRAKIQETNVQRYGVKFFTNTETLKQHNKTAFGGMSHSTSLIQHAAECVNDPIWLKQQNVNKNIREIAEDVDVSVSLIQKRMKTFGVIPCVHTVSAFERSVEEYLKSIYEGQIFKQYKVNGVSVDLYLADLNLAIECDGLYWHGENSRTPRARRYHYEKTVKCNAAGVRLIHITDYEWYNKPDIVKSRLLAFVGKSTRIYARDCVIVELTNKQAAQFLLKTHIQGSVAAPISYGLCRDGELVAVMTFGKPRFGSGCEWELLRFSSSLNTTVIGGASRLLTHFIRRHSPQSIVSYSDNRWGSGTVYERLRFIFSHNSSPGYVYYQDDYLKTGIHSRVKFQRHKLSKAFGKPFDESLTEWDIMRNRGFNRYWDCGNGVWKWISPTAG